MCFFKFYGTTDTNLWMDFKERYQLEIKTIGNKNYISIGVSVRQQNSLPITIVDCTRDNWQIDMVAKVGKHNKKMDV